MAARSSIAPATHLLSHQRSEAEDKLLYALIDWLLPHLRLRMPEKQSRWEGLWRLFKADGTMGWDEFERFLRYDCKLSPRKLFELLDVTGSGRIASKTLLEVRREYERIIDCRQAGLDDLKVILLRNYGNLMRAWRRLFDIETRGRCGHNWFVRSCREIGFHGDLKTAWAELTQGDIHRPMFMADLDPVAAALIKEFVIALARCHGSARDGWYSLIRAHGTNGRMEPDNFDRVCQEMSISSKTSRKVFGYLDTDGSKTISLDEWHFVALWEDEVGDDESMMGSSVHGPMQGRANIGGAPLARRGSPGGYPDGVLESSSPKKKTAWHNAHVVGEASTFDLGEGGEADVATVEFHVILTKEEHKEYLRRRRELEMQSLSARSKQPIARGPAPRR